MNNLWKKETSQDVYVDLYASVKDPLIDMHVELMKIKKTQKNNDQSNEWRRKGNEFFRQKNWLDALEYYNQSLCFAEVGSENVALAYSNRSACFFHMMNYNEVLIDIELAKNANLPEHLIPKLEQRKSESLNLLTMINRLKKMMKNDVPKYEPKLSYKSDKNFPCMANVLEIKYNQEFGRHLVAKCDIPAGRTVLAEKDFMKIRIEPVLCYTCLRVYKNGIACPNCPDVAFCSSDCMNKNQNHKYECGSYFPHLPREMRFGIKTILIAINNFSSVDDLMQFVEDALLDLETLPTSLTDSKTNYSFFFKLATSGPHPSALTDAYEFYKIVMSLPKVSTLFDSERKKRFLMHLVMHHLLIINTNSVGSENIKFVASVSSLLNHSCYPNLVDFCYFGNTFRVTGRPVKKGEQLFVNYSCFDMPSDTNERKAKLKSGWGFECKCERCEPTCAPLDGKLVTSDPSYKYVVENQHNMDDTANIKRKCVEFLNKYGRTAWSSEIEHIFKVYRRHIVNGEW